MGPVRWNLSGSSSEAVVEGRKGIYRPTKSSSIYRCITYNTSICIYTYDAQLYFVFIFELLYGNTYVRFLNTEEKRIRRTTFKFLELCVICLQKKAFFRSVVSSGCSILIQMSSLRDESGEGVAPRDKLLGFVLPLADGAMRAGGTAVCSSVWWECQIMPVLSWSRSTRAEESPRAGETCVTSSRRRRNRLPLNYETC